MIISGEFERAKRPLDFFMPASLPLFGLALFSVLIAGTLLAPRLTSVQLNNQKDSVSQSAYMPSKASTKKSPKSLPSALKSTSGGTSVLASAQSSSLHLAPPFPACTPYTQPTIPTALDLTAAPAGLSTLYEAASHYRVYGYNHPEIEAQILACAPRTGDGGAGFAGETSYSLNWSYNYTPTQAGICRLSNIKVGVHIQTVEPLWQATPYAEGGLAAKWESFTNGLTTHERGHASLDEHYAAQLLSNLKAMPPLACDGVNRAVNTQANSIIAELNDANDNYDAQTNHGATQGAIIP